MRGIRRFGVLALAAVMLSPFVPASISHASGGETVTISGLDPVAASGSDTFSVSLSGFDTSANYIVVLSASDGQLTIEQSGSATALFGYDPFSGDPSSVTSDEIGFEGSHSDISTMLGSVVFTASGTLGEPDLSVSVAEKPDGANIYYWPGDDSTDSARYYRYVADANVTWTDAEADARSTSSPDNRLGGIPGYLVRPSTYEENQFVSQKVDALNIWIAARRGTATGISTADDWFWVSHTGTNGPSSSENGAKFYDENWSGTWTTEQSKLGFVDFTLWNNPAGTFVTPWTSGEPNGTNTDNEFYASTNYDLDNDGRLEDSEKALWNDFTNAVTGDRIKGYVVEYNAHQMTTLASDVATASATVASAPDAPGAPSVTVAPGQATVSWSAPDSNFSTITGYTATASPTGGGSSETCTTATTSCVISGLTASTSYDFTVTATNAMGTSSASTVSAGIIPDDPEVKFDSNSGTGTMSDQVGNSATALSANTFEREDFSFVGWNTESDGSGTDYADGDTYAFDSDLTLYAQWKKTLPPHIAANDAFVQPGSTTGGTASVLNLKNAEDSETSTFNRVGYVRFEYDPSYSWTSAAFEMLVSKNDEGTSPNGYGVSYTSFNVEVWGMSNAEWDDTITFTSANASTEDWGIDTSQWPWEPEGGTYLGAFSVPTNSDTIGQTFSLSNADLVAFLNGDTDGEVTLFFRRSDTDDQGNLEFASAENTTTGYHGPRLVVPGGSYSYTLAYDINGGTGAIPDPGTYTQGGTAYTIVDGTNVTPPTGEAFSGWNTKADGTGTSFAPGASYSTAASATLYAQYTSDPVITFNSNDGQSNRAFQVVSSGVAEALDSNPFSRSGHTFLGWSTLANGSGTDFADEVDVTLTNNLTLYAQWQSTSSGGTSGGTSDDEDPDVSGLPKIPTTTPGTFGLPPRPPGFLPPRFPGGNGPVVFGGPPETPRNPNGPLTTPRGFVGGLPTPTETSEDDDGGVTVTTGSLRLGLRPVPIPGEPGLPGNGGMGMPVPHGGSTEFRGGGLLPGSQLQVFLTGGSQRELGRIPVSQTGEFDGEIQFNTPRGEAQLPIGPHVIQAIGYDAEGKQTIVEVPINIAQGPATPETDRVSGELPNLGLGTSSATSAGVPIDVNVTGVPETRTVTVDGGDFGFVIQSNGQAQVENTPTSARVFLDSSSTVSITGNGLMSDTTASVWVFSTPTQLATVQVDPSGGMSTDVLIDPQFIEPGNHTLQIQAVGTDGFIRSFNIGVVIEDPTDVPTASSASTLLWWVAGLFALLLAVVGGGLRWKRRNAHPIGI